MLSRDFIKLVALALVIAIPVAWFAMSSRLNTYEYRIPIGWQVFALSAGLAILVAVLTVSYQSIRAAVANPAESLRAE